MKKFYVWLCAISILSVFAIGAGTVASGVTFGSGSGSVCLLPARNINSAPSWQAAVAYTAGTCVSTNGRIYTVVSNSTSTASGPTNLTGILVIGESAYLANPSDKQLRKGLAISNNSTNRVTVTFGRPAVAGEGFSLPNLGSQLVITENVPQEAVFATCTGTGANVTALDW